MSTAGVVSPNAGVNQLRRPDNQGVAKAGTGCEPLCQISFPPPCSPFPPCGLPCDLIIGPERHSILQLGNMARLAVIATPGMRSSFRREADELVAQIMCILRRHRMAQTATTMMVFLRDGADEAECRQIVQSWFGNAMPVMTFVVQPPCCGAALGIELWAWSGPRVRVDRLGPQLISIETDGIRWVHCGGIQSERITRDPYAESCAAFEHMEREFATAGVGMEDVVRTWIYLNQITSGETGTQRYQEFNRARTQFYQNVKFGRKNRAAWVNGTVYPASTGIGTMGKKIAMGAMALQSKRPDVFIVPLENPRQTAACNYHTDYSPHSPKFARAMAVVQGHFVSTLVSGTASIVDSKTVFAGDIVRQTRQTLDNIERLISAENFARHGLVGSGSTIFDIAKLRVYVKHGGDYERCRKEVERRLPGVPAIYLRADVCRPDLLVEIEAVAFSLLHRNETYIPRGHESNSDTEFFEFAP